MSKKLKVVILFLSLNLIGLSVSRCEKKKELKKSTPSIEFTIEKYKIPKEGKYLSFEISLKNKGTQVATLIKPLFDSSSTKEGLMFFCVYHTEKEKVPSIKEFEKAKDLFRTLEIPHDVAPSNYIKSKDKFFVLAPAEKVTLNKKFHNLLLLTTHGTLYGRCFYGIYPDKPNTRQHGTINRKLAELPLIEMETPIYKFSVDSKIDLYKSPAE